MTIYYETVLQVVLSGRQKTERGLLKKTVMWLAKQYNQFHERQ